MCLFPRHLKIRLQDGNFYDMKVPCGKCIECLNVRTHDWEFRLQNELKNSFFGLFVTLTYQDEFLPQNGVNVHDLQKFFKHLRNRNLKCSYYAIGEYGTNFQRPHYHVLLFVKNDDLSYHDLQNIVYDSWNKGFITSTPMHFGRIHYCVAYLIGSKYPKGKNKPFTVCSKRPALGSELLNDSKFVEQLQKNDFKFVYRKGKKVHCPRFYKKKLSTKVFTGVDLIEIYCNNCIKEYQDKLNFLSSNSVVDSRGFLTTSTTRYYKQFHSIPVHIIEDLEKFLDYQIAHNKNKDYILKQRAKKLRND